MRLNLTYLIIILLSILIFSYLEIREKTYITSEIAYLEADEFSLTSKFLSKIVLANFELGDKVKKGDVLVQFDSSLYQEKAKINALERQRVMGNIALLIAEEKATLEQINKKVSSLTYLTNAKLNASAILKKIEESTVKSISDVELGKLRSDALTLGADVEISEAELLVLKFRIEEIKQLQIDLENKASIYAAEKVILDHDILSHKITAPFNGYISRKHILTDELAASGQEVATIINLDSFRVVAYLPETELRFLGVGSTAKVIFDAYPDTELSGTVTTINHISGVAFSGVKPNYTSGYVTKTTQRIPIMIHLEDVPHDIFLSMGMSAKVTIIKND